MYSFAQMRIVIAIDRLLTERGRSFYWLAKETGIGYSTLWRLKTGKSLGINFATLLKICVALNCTPGDIFVLDRKEGDRKPDLRSSASDQRSG
jgi:putative transcriptional regulator